jgi:hypothetical protein
MEMTLKTMTEQGLARLGATHCRVVDVVFSQAYPALVVIVVACEGKKPLPIVLEDTTCQADLEPFILQKLQAYLTTN